jgi:hypothetical protein
MMIVLTLNNGMACDGIRTLASHTDRRASILVGYRLGITT